MIKVVSLFTFLFICLPAVYAWCYKTKFAGASSIKSIDFSFDGQYIVTGQKSGRVMLWKFDSLEVLKVYNFPGIVEQAVISKDQTQLAIGGNSDDVMILNFPSFTHNRTLDTDHGHVWDLDFNYDSDRLVTCGDDKKFRTWRNKGDWSQDQEEQMHHEITTCQFSMQDDILGAGDHFVQAWKDAGGSQQFEDHKGDNNFQENWFWGLRARHSQRYFIAVHQEGNAFQFNTDTGARTKITGLSVSNLTGIGYSMDDTYFALTGQSSKVFMFNATNKVNTLEKQLQTNSSTDLISARFSYDSNYFATGNQDGTVFLFYRFCQGCPIGHYRNQTYCRQCYLDIPGCAICENSTLCLGCNGGLYLNNGLCSSCDVMNGCAICSSNSNCTSCVFGYYLSGLTCSLCYSNIEGCLDCSDASNCLKCDTKYTLVGGDCEPCYDHLDNCAFCNSSSYCLECINGFYEDAGVCKNCVSPCKICHAVDNCTECISGFYATSGSCSPCSTGCSVCNNTAKCLDCQEGFFITATFTCSPCVHPCSTCNTTNICRTCVLGYFLSATGVCTNCPSACLACNSTNYCHACDTGYYLDTGTHSCKKCHQIDGLCHSCNSTHCLDCEEGSLIQADGSCSPCTSEILNCMICSNNSICEHCKIGYYPSGLTGDDSCKACEPGCRSCQNSTQCSVCQPGYYFSSGNCDECVAPCLTCSTSTSTCISCPEGLYISGTTCLLCKDQIDNCQSCLTNAICLTCDIGYTLTAPNTCSQCTHPCVSCSVTTSNCLTCAIGYFISSNTCDLCHSNCTECSNAADNCTSCANGYYLSSTDCLPCSIDGCATCSSSNNCIQCQSGYYPQIDGSCLACSSPIPHCLKCSTDGSTCSLCEYGFVLASLNTTCDPCSTHLDDCEHCSDTTVCEVCMTGFFTNSTFDCEICSEGCYSCSDGANCDICIDTYVQVGGDCILCESSVAGCHLCSALGTCDNCLEGYYLQTGDCHLCAEDLVGCESCISSSQCVQCSVFYELDTVNDKCVLCSENYDFCQTCFNGQCKQCQVGTYLDSGVCHSCQNIDPACLYCNSNSDCIDCMSGYYLSSSNCHSCDVTYPHCIYCDDSDCLQCESGYYLLGGSCTQCPNQGCEICSPDDPTKCLTCNSRYFLNSDVCELCSSQLDQCMQCSDSSICTQCSHGFYLDSSSHCQLCSDLFDGCSSCTPTSCVDCMSNFFLDTSTSTHFCNPCTDFLVGCAFCSSSTVCLTCQNGYYISGNSCEPCSTINGCLYCTDSTTCTKCQQSYYFQSNQCLVCGDAIQNCFACDDSSTCITCQGNYRLISGQCQQIKGQSLYDYPQLTLQSYYKDSENLKHVLSSRKQKFKQIDHDWNTESKLWLIGSDYEEIELTIKNVSWSSDSYDMIWITDNPIDKQLSQSTNKMPFLPKRRLQASTRLLPQSSMSSNFQFKFMMSQQATHDVLPSLDHLGDLYLDYPMDDPEFYRSYLEQKNYYHFIFGLIVTIILFLMYAVKVLAILPESKNRGQIIPHILAIKCGGLALYPTYGEFINYCYGFMSADIPWANSKLGPSLGRQDDIIPSPHAMYYTNLSISSTYLLALSTIVFIWMLVSFLAYMDFISLRKSHAFKSFIYNFFILGATIAGCLSLEGALLNPINSINSSSIWYIIGIMLYIIIFVEIIYSIATKRNSKNISLVKKNKIDEEQKGMTDNFHKLRIFFKATLLSVLHLNPLYFFIALFCFQLSAISIDYFIRHKQKACPKAEIIQHILVNIALGMIICVPSALLGILVVSALIVIVIVVDVYINCKEPEWLRSLKVVKNKNDSIYNLRKYDQTEIDLIANQEKKIGIWEENCFQKNEVTVQEGKRKKQGSKQNSVRPL